MEAMLPGGSTPGQLPTLVFLGIFIFLTAIGLFKGLGRGIGRQIVRIATIAISFIAALIATSSIGQFLHNLCDGKTIDEVLMALGLHETFEQEIYDLLACFDATTAEHLIELPLMSIILPFVFTSCFVVVSAVLLIVHAIFCGIFRLNGKRAGVGSHLLGMILGACQGAVVAVIFMLPFLNLVGIAAETNAIIVEHHQDEEPAEFSVLYDEYVAGLYENPIFTVSYTFTEPLCDHFATIEIEDRSVNLRETTALLCVAVDDFVELGDFDWTAPTSEQCDALESIVDSLSHDTYVATILSGALRGLATAIDSGVIEFNLEEPVRGVMNNLMHIFTTLNADNFGRDVDTLLEVYFLLAREQVLASLPSGDPAEITTACTAEDENGTTVIRKIINTIQSNEHMKPLVTMLTKLSLSVMMNNVGMENGEAVYESIKEGIAGVIAINKTEYETDEEYHAAVSSSLDDTLKSHDIVLAPEIVDNMATYVVDNFADLENVSDDEVNDTILSYYEAYMKYVNEGGENPFPGIIPDNDEGDGEGEGGEALPDGTLPDGETPEGTLPDGDPTEETLPEQNDPNNEKLPEANESNQSH